MIYLYFVLVRKIENSQGISFFYLTENLNTLSPKHDCFSLVEKQMNSSPHFHANPLRYGIDCRLNKPSDGVSPLIL